MKKVLSIFIACIITITMVSCNNTNNNNKNGDSKNSDSLPVAALKSEGTYNGSLVNTTWLVPIGREFYEFSFAKDSMKIQEYRYSWDKENLKYTLLEIKTETVPCIVSDDEITFDKELIDSYYDTDIDLYNVLRNYLGLLWGNTKDQITLYYRVIDSVAFLIHRESRIPESENLQDYLELFPFVNSNAFNKECLVMYYKHTEYSNDELLEFLDGTWIGTKTEDIDESQDFESQCTDAFEINAKEKNIVFSKKTSFWIETDELSLIDFISNDITGAIGYIDMIYNGNLSENATLVPWPSRMFVEIIDEQTIRILHYKDSINMYIFKRSDSMPESLEGTDEHSIETANSNAKTAYNAISAFAQKCDTAGKKLSADNNVVTPIISIDASNTKTPNPNNITSAVAGSNELADGAEEELSNALSQSFSNESDDASVIIIFNKDGYPQKVYYANKDSEFVGCYPDELTEKTSGGIKTYLN